MRDTDPGWQLILPGDPLFDYTLATARPPGWKETAAKTDGQMMFVARAGSGILEPAPMKQINEYLEEEYDERLAEIEEMDNFYAELDIML